APDYFVRRFANDFQFLSLLSAAIDYAPAMSRLALWMGTLGLLLCAMLIHVVQAAPQEPLPATIEFNRDIRPILSDKCFQCHGPASQQATLRLDLEDGARHALSGGRFAIVPGDPANSQMIKRITATNPAIRMP